MDGRPPSLVSIVDILERFVRRLADANDTLALSVAQLSCLIDSELLQLERLSEELGLCQFSPSTLSRECLLASINNSPHFRLPFAMLDNANYADEKSEGIENSDFQWLGVNVEKLETDVRRCVRAEERHWCENDAKLRAVEQRVASYNEFRDLVNGCELHPVKPSEVGDPSKTTPLWAPSSLKIYHVRVKSCTESSVQKDLKPHRFHNFGDFILCWHGLEKHQSDRELAQLLFMQSEELLQSILSFSSGPPILSAILRVLLTVVADDSADVLRVLKAISSCRNFGIAALLFSDEERALIGKIFGVYENATGQQLDAELLKKWLPM